MTTKKLHSKYDLTWIDIANPSAAEIAHISFKGDIEHDDADIILNGAERPFLEKRRDYTFIYLNLPIYDEKTDAIKAAPFSMIIKGKEFYTFHADEMHTLKRFFESLKHDVDMQAKYMQEGLEMFIPALLRRLLLRTLPMVDKISVEVDQLEEHLINNRGQDFIVQISKLRRNLIDIRRLIQPLESLIERFKIEDIPFFTPHNNRPYATVQNAYSNVWQVIEAENNTLNDLAQAHIAVVQNHTNRTIKILTIFSALFLPLNLVYNLFISQQNSQLLGGLSVNFLITLGVMIFVGALTYIIFKSKKLL